MGTAAASAEIAARYWRDREWLHYAMHELPAGVLWGPNAATEGQCEEMTRGLDEFAALCAELQLHDHQPFLDGCRWHLEHYPHYLGRRRHFSSYESYVADRGGPRRVEDPPAPPVWLVRKRREGRAPGT